MNLLNIAFLKIDFSCLQHIVIVETAKEHLFKQMLQINILAKFATVANFAKILRAAIAKKLQS